MSLRSVQRQDVAHALEEQVVDPHAALSREDLLKRPSLSDALAKKDFPSALSVVPETVAGPAPKPNDGRMATTIRIEPERLEALFGEQSPDLTDADFVALR